MNFKEMSEAVDEAARVRRTADWHVAKMAGMCAGRLRISSVRHSVLCELKRELANYNMHTGTWRK